MDATPATRDARVRHIAEMMASGQWLKSYKMRCSLAEKWKCEETTIRSYAAEAHRLLAMDPEEREQLRITLANHFHNIAEQALSTCNQVTGLPDYNAVLKALDLYARYASVSPKEEIESTLLPTTVNIVYSKHLPEQTPEFSASSTSKE